jgi:Sec-independent protein translocase protein TatA
MIVALILLVVFGSRKASSMARELGHLANEARRPVEEFKSELAAAVEDREEPAIDLRSGSDEDGTPERVTKSKRRTGWERRNYS